MSKGLLVLWEGGMRTHLLLFVPAFSPPFMLSLNSKLFKIGSSKRPLSTSNPTKKVLSTEGDRNVIFQPSTMSSVSTT